MLPDPKQTLVISCQALGRTLDDALLQATLWEGCRQIPEMSSHLDGNNLGTTGQPLQVQ